MSLQSETSTEKHTVAYEFLLSSARTDAEPEQIASLLDVLAAEDWNEVLSQAILHRVCPLVAQTLNSTKLLASTPEPFLFSVCSRTNRHATSVRFAVRELDRVLMGARAAGLQPVLFKGLSLAAYYGAPALRHLGDIDLIVAEAEVIEMLEVARKLGYVVGEWSDGKPNLWDNEEIEFPLNVEAGRRHMPPMICPSTQGQPYPASLDIHPNVVRPDIADEFDVISALNRVQETEIAGIAVRVLDPVDALWAYAMNFYRDTASILTIMMEKDLRLSRYCDIRELLAHSSDDVCTTLLTRAKTVEARRACAHALCVTEALFPGCVPSDALEQLSAEHPDSQRRIILDIPSPKLLGVWSRDVCERIFDTKRIIEVLPLWWDLGHMARGIPAILRTLEDKLGVLPPENC